MIKLLKYEYLKTRKRYIMITALAITAFELLWVFHGSYDDFMLDNGWMMFLYQLPIINGIFLPLLSIIIAVRLADIEHKGSTLKLLCASVPKGKIYDAKLLYGLIIITAALVVQFGGIIIFGKVIGFRDTLPLNLYALYFMFTAIITFTIYTLQHTLSLLFKNQAVSFFVGIIGEFFGIIFLFLPSLLIRKFFLWAYYGVLGFVGMFGWRKETRYTYAYFDVMNIDWTAFIMLIAASVVLYLVGRKIFCKKEI